MALPAPAPFVADVPALDNTPSVWEAATMNRSIVLDRAAVYDSAHEAVTEQRERQKKTQQALDDAKKKHRQPPKDLYAPIMQEPVSDMSVEKVFELAPAWLASQICQSGNVTSSYPHLSPGKDATPEHVTSSRVVGQVAQGNVNYIVHERFHQNNGSRVDNMPRSDRFFAVDPEGRVFQVTAAFNNNGGNADAHKLAKLFQATCVASRSEAPRPLLASSVEAFVNWTVGQADEREAPLSPRSSQRRVPEHGYGLPKGHKK
jgi:hypothetical protein